MGDDPPVIYLLYGEDEFGIKKFVARLQARLGDATTAKMNTTHIEGNNFSLGELRNVIQTIPFLASRRLVILHDPLASFKSKASQDNFKDLLKEIHPSTALVITVHSNLKANHWLLKWVKSEGTRGFVRSFPLLQGMAMSKWIMNLAKKKGGQFTPQAAGLLASLVAENPRMVANEINKLLDYANYQRPVEVDDVEHLTSRVPQGDVFKMVDAIGNQNGPQALNMLSQLLTERDPLSLFGMIVRQFRLLLLAKEWQEENAAGSSLAKILKVPDFVARKVLAQARNFTLPELESIYRQLLALDEKIKTGKMNALVALDTMIVMLTM